MDRKVKQWMQCKGQGWRAEVIRISHISMLENRTSKNYKIKMDRVGRHWQAAVWNAKHRRAEVL